MSLMMPRVLARRAPRDEPRDRHDAKVERIARELARRDSGPVSLKKKAVAHQVPKRGDKRRHDAKIDVGDLDEILEIDPIARTCVAEPGVTFVDLVAATLKHGLAPIVVPELETITIGGAVSGCSLESASFRHGGFHDTCLEYEVITTDGVVLRCTPTNEHRLVFQMMHGSFGTLGVLSKLRFRLVPAKPYVKVTYDTYPTLREYTAAIRRYAAAEDVDFIDGIIHGPDKYVLSVGRFVDEAPYTHRYDWVRVYWKSTGTRIEDYLRTRDYFFRYDRGVTNVQPRSFVGRLLFGKLLSSSRLLRLADVLNRFLSADRPNVTVDLFLPIAKLEPFMRWYRSAIDHFPLWCVPYRRVRYYEWIAPDYFDGVDDEMFVDIAVYGLAQPPGRNYYKEIEDELPKVRGIKTLISHNFYDEETFWTIWNKASYDAVKAITDPKNLLRDVYTKTCRAARGL
ncbi:MAG: FAD-binding oxidoreductase [Labilithrix sp.]|nr:FAD-binding oxidoreductase [Labilithrix sp.]MCW5833876.1 FAD-binding oxidoreductase [Labilithrix sp.]